MEPVLTRAAMVEAAPDVVARRLGDGAVLVHLPSNRIFELNDTGARVWELICAGQSLEDIAQRLVAEYEVDPADAEAKLHLVVSDLRGAGLVR